jgi:uncharacterized protein YmfQ (DUF2313 family)
MSNTFKPNTILENTNALVAYLPNGRLFAAKNVAKNGGSNMRNLYASFAPEFTRLQNKIYEVSVEDDLANTTNLIDEWESALGIPDTCLSKVDRKGNLLPIEQRRKQIVAKFALMNITTEQDWVDLAWFFGYRIKIEYGITYGAFTYEFPVYFAGSAKAARFTMIIRFLDYYQPLNVFTLNFPITFEDFGGKFLMCLFTKLKPANVKIHWRWKI